MGKMDEIIRMNAGIGIDIYDITINLVEIMPSVPITDVKSLAYFDNLMEFFPAVVL